MPRFDGKVQIRNAAKPILDGKVVPYVVRHSDASSGICGLPGTSALSGLYCFPAKSGIAGLAALDGSSGIIGLSPEIESSARGGVVGIEVDKSQVSSGIEGSVKVQRGSALAGCSALSIGSAIIGGEGLPFGDRIWAYFNRKNMDSVSAVSSQEDLATVVRVLFDYDYGKKSFRKAVELESKDAIVRYGRIEKEIQSYWIGSFRLAVELGERQLNYHARPKWKVSFVTSLDYANIPPGGWISVDKHPLIPFSGIALVTDAPLDLSAGEVSFIVEKNVGSPVVSTVIELSKAFKPIVPSGPAITYENGVATFTILNELGDPLADASVMLDGVTVHVTDQKGQVQFVTARGKHRLLVEATGYASLEFEVQV